MTTVAAIILLGVTPAESPSAPAASPAVPAQAPAAVGRILTLRGSAQLTDKERQQPVERGMFVPAGGTIATAAESAVRVRLNDGSLIDLGASTQLSFAAFSFEPGKTRKASFKLTVGRIWARVTSWLGGENHFEVETDNAVAGVRGTELIIQFDKAGVSSVIVVGGSVELQDAARKLTSALGPMAAGLWSGKGEITVREVTAAELADAARDVSIGPQLSAQDRQRLTNVPATGEDEAPELSPLDQLPALGLPIEPGSGRGNLRGHVEVR